MTRPRSIQQLTEALQKFPGVGPRTAIRMAESILNMPYDDALEISRAVLRVKKIITKCSSCNANTENNPCDICTDENRDREFVCVVQSSTDVEALEKSKSHSGVYHVLDGVINPAKGIGPEKIFTKTLFEKAHSGKIKEILIATDTSLEGDATASYVYQQLKDTEVKITRPARGLPMGADLDYLDGKTLQQAYTRRTEIGSDRNNDDD